MSSLLDRLPPRDREIAHAAREVGQQQHARVYLVGGPLRDLLLGNPLVDLDFAMEAGSEAFARELARRTGGTLRAYPQFMTYKLLVNGVPPIDITTTRKEAYPEPGALPVVSPSGLRDDLFRRDFTVNAMALELVSQQIEDPFGGMADLREGRIRILHDRSFIDDPTRIYRGLRLAVRLGFKVEPRTDELMREAIARKVATTVSRERLFRELFLAVRESVRARVLYRFAATGALELLLGVRDFPDDLQQRLDSVDRILLELGGDAEVVFLAILLHGKEISDAILAGSGLTQKQIDTLRGIQARVPEFSSQMRRAGSDLERLELCSKVSPEVRVLAAASDPAIASALVRYAGYEKLDIGVRGDQLQLPGGPHIGRALERTRRALFLGEITRAEALAFARRAALEYLERNDS